MRKITFFKTMLAAVLLLVGSASLMSQGLETFENHALSGTTYVNGSFVGNNSITWTYVQVTGEQTYPIENKGILLRRSDAPSSITSSTISGGIGSFSVQMRKAFTGTGDRQIALYINGSHIADSQTFGAATGADETIHTFSVPNINIEGDFVLEIRHITGGGTNRQLVIDNLTWTAYLGGGTPTVATPTFSIAGVPKSTDTYFNSADVSISSITQGSAVYYTTNGDNPTTASALFSSPVSITSTTTFKAIAVKDGMDNSAIAERTISIVQPATATVPYTEAFNNTLGDWYAVEVAGNKPFGPTVDGAYVNGFGGGNVESWLISPKFTSTESTLGISFNYASKFPGNPLLVKFSADYAGFGNPSSATWTTLKAIAAPEARDDDYTVKSSGDIVIATTGTVYFALVYAATTDYSDWRITNASVDISTAPPTPTITVTEVSVPAMNAVVGDFDAVDITVNGVNLTGNITVSISGTNADYFTASPPVIAAESGMVLNAMVSVTYMPLAAGSHTATLTLSSPGADDVTRALSGTAVAPLPQLTPPDVIISEVYGGGGNSGAPFNADFVELFNTTDSQIDIGGWSVQYYSATGTSANVIVIPDGKIIPAKGHFLISAAGGSVGSNLPTPDVSSTTPNISATNGKLALYTVVEAQALTEPLTIEQIINNVAFKDYVAFGSAQPQWGSPLASPSNSTSATRKMVGGNYSYTQQLGYDFVIMTPSPTNSGITSVNRPEMRLDVYAVNGAIRFQATAGQLVEVYNVIGQKIVTAISRDGLNAIPLKEKGMMVVRIGDRTAKVVL